MMKLAVAESMQKSHSYVKYRAIVTNLLKDGKSSGKEQSETLTHYSELNEARMNRLDKKMVILEENIQKLLALKKNYIWLVLSEGWCGDAAQILPVMNKMASIAPNIDLKIVFRDENESLMHAFLTNGAKSIPKLIVLDAETLNVHGSWGPRPKGATDLFISYRRQYGKIDETAKTELQLWYLHDKGVGTQTEISDLMVDLDNLMYAKR
ncbi:MAG TPA: thioredoxin family protein [Flavobacterium sp.]|nr:thioredoxin family protein [Flavobacterium sp.]